MYRVRATVAYLWDQGQKSLDLVKAIYNNDATFKRMVRQVQRSILNIFKGTDPHQKVLTG